MLHTRILTKLVTLLVLTFVLCIELSHRVECKSSAKAYWTNLMTKALELSRNARWNEFNDEDNIYKTSSQRQSANKTPSSTQSLIDETKDPNSPYYISMISSNIGSNHLPPSPSINNSNDGSNNSHKPAQSGIISKLFNYAFSTTAPSRVMQTTKRPLITFINVSNLEEHDSESQSNLSESSTLNLHLLNNAETNSETLQIKRRLPECATQQVCSAHYVKSNHTQRLCHCPHDFNWDCDTGDHMDDHIIDLTRRQEFKTQRNSLAVYTQVKLCENLRTIKPCKTPTDWTIMALQSERTAKAHYVVVCKCPDSASFEGPFTHKHPPYARFPGIRVYGMLCNQGIRKSKNNRAMEIDQNSNEYPEFPWELAYAVINSTTLQGFW